MRSFALAVALFWVSTTDLVRATKIYEHEDEELYTADGERKWVSAGETNQPAAAPAPTRSGPDTVAMEQAKAAWLAKQQVPSWGLKAAVTPAPEEVVAPGAAAARAVDSLSACEEQSREEEAKAAWLAEQVPPALTPQP